MNEVALSIGTNAKPLRQRDFRFFLAGSAISLIGDGAATVALPFAVLAVTGSLQAVGYVFAARMTPLVALLLIGGVLADRFPRLRLMVSADLARLAAQGATAGLLIAGQATLRDLLVLQAINGAATAMFDPAIIGVTPATVAEPDLQQANAYRGTASGAAQILGPLVGSALLLAGGAGVAISFDALTFASSALLLSAMSAATTRAKKPTRRSFVGDLAEGWRLFAGTQWVWSIVTMAAVINALSASLLVLGPAVAQAAFRGGAAWGVMVASLGAGAAVGGLVGVRIAVPRPLALGALLAALMALPEVSLALTAPFVAICIAAFVAGGGSTLFSALWTTELQLRLPQRAISRISAYDWLGSLLLRPLGLVGAGVAAAAIGRSQTLLLAAALTFAAALAVLLSPAVREQGGRRTRHARA